MGSAERGGHPIKKVVSLILSEEEVTSRWETAKRLGDRGSRADDESLEVFRTRILEYKEKTLPVLETYRKLGILVEIPAEGSREEVYRRVLEGIERG